MDRASHAKAISGRQNAEPKDLQAVLTLIERTLGTLDIAMIHALSLHAKGRVGRSFSTLKDRLIKEMRVANVCILSEANHFLEHEFIPFWNGRFSIAPVDPTDTHRRVPKGTDLQQLFTYEEQRVISPDFVIRYRNVFYQSEKPEADARIPKSKITVETRLEGSLQFRWHQRYLNPYRIPEVVHFYLNQPCDFSKSIQHIARDERIAAFEQTDPCVLGEWPYDARA